jgi:hypothetical protein
MPSATVNAERRQRQIAEEIARPGLCLPGSLVERTTRCSSARCRCHSDPSQLHGPYPSWIGKAGTRTFTRTLSPAQLERYRPLFGNTKRLRELISELETLSAEAVEQAEGWTRTYEGTSGAYSGYSEGTLQITCPRRGPRAAALTAKTPRFGLQIRRLCARARDGSDCSR